MRSCKLAVTTIFSMLTIVLVSSALSGCFPVVVGGVAAGGLMVADRRTSGAYIEDQSIELKIEKNIKDELGDNIHINVTSYNRNVLLTGEATNEATKVKAESLAKVTENVRSITNEISVAMISSMSSRSKDSYLTSKVKGRMLSENRFPPNYVKVVTENSVVFLMGMVSHKEADDAVEIARGTDGVEKVVKVFEYVD